MLLIKHKKLDMIMSQRPISKLRQYFIKDNYINQYISILNDEESIDINYKFIKEYIESYDVHKILLVLSERKIYIRSREFNYYRIFNGEKVFWAKSDEFIII